MSGASVLVPLGILLADGPSDGKDFTPTSVTPGLAGFMAIFLVALVTVLLILDMTRRIRRSQARERVAQRRREEEREQARGSGPAPGEDDGPQRRR